MNRIQQILRDHADLYLEQHGDRIPRAHQKVIRAICECRSGERGHHLFACPDCGDTHVACSSCGNRHCPVCQHEKATEWVYRQQLRLLPCTYFLATFTIPDELRALARTHQQVVYDAMFNCAAESLRTLEADKRFVGCNVAGFFGVLHTWGRQLQYHPHVHFVIPGGGLTKNRDRWIAANGDFLVHVRALSAMFRGKLRAALAEAGLLSQVAEAVWSRNWVVHCEAVGDGRAVMKYLGAYVMRVAISASRIVAYDGKSVRIKYQKVGSSKWRFMELSVMEFMRRFLQHVLPNGFVKIRHYGFMSPNFSVPLQKIRELICALYELLRNQPVKVPPPRKPKPLKCPRCSAIMEWRLYIPFSILADGPPGALVT
ncbi:MAG: IS91 family transposase [Kiritimatiellae bacterium]|nr:IS91 family transposase [Kiritimatiellia bacterium]